MVTWVTAARGSVGLPNKVPAARAEASTSSPRTTATTVDGAPLSVAPSTPAATGRMCLFLVALDAFTFHTVEVRLSLVEHAAVPAGRGRR
jgi:hypothetical protein